MVKIVAPLHAHLGGYHGGIAVVIALELQREWSGAGIIALCLKFVSGSDVDGVAHKHIGWAVAFRTTADILGLVNDTRAAAVRSRQGNAIITALRDCVDVVRAAKGVMPTGIPAEGRTQQTVLMLAIFRWGGEGTKCPLYRGAAGFFRGIAPHFHRRPGLDSKGIFVGVCMSACERDHDCENRFDYMRQAVRSIAAHCLLPPPKPVFSARSGLHSGVNHILIFYNSYCKITFDGFSVEQWRENEIP